MNRVYAGCRESGLPVLLHTGDYRFDFSNPAQLVNVLEKFPDLQVIGTHMGGWSVYAEAMERLPGYPNIVVDCSSSFCDLTIEETMAIFRAFGTERILYGTDFPIIVPGFDMDYFLRLPLTETEREDILWRNAVKAYNLSPRGGNKKPRLPIIGAGGVLFFLSLRLFAEQKDTSLVRGRLFRILRIWV